MKHAPAVALFAALAIAWTWPLARHLGDALPGDPGDNYSFVWNLWWMRHVIATPALGYFHTTYLFHPFGTTIADHPHTALPALVAATVLKQASVVAAQNMLLIAYVFGNMLAMYALAWSILASTINAELRVARRASVLAAIVFGLSPYIAVHLLGHFDLVAAFTLPLYALALRHAVRIPLGAPQSSLRNPLWLPAAAAGLLLAATAYIAYYYVVYLVFFTVVYLLAWIDPIALAPTATPPSPVLRRLRLACAAGAAICAAAAAAIIVTGGRTISVGSIDVSVHAPQNILTAAWIFVAAAVAIAWPRSIHVRRAASSNWVRATAVAWRVAAVFTAGAAPLLWQAARLIARGEYVTPDYGWRSIPHGVDLLAPLLGHPLHPLFQTAASRAYGALGQNFVEAIGWMGIVPPLLLATTALTVENAEIAEKNFSELHIWRIVAVAFAIWSLGPFLVIGGFDTGLKLPAILLRFVPFVANARMPGRAMVGVFMAIAVLLAIQLAGTGAQTLHRGGHGGRRGPNQFDPPRLPRPQWWRVSLARPVVQWLAIALVVFEYWAAPIRLTTLDRPAVYQALAAAEPGAVCEVPMGIGDGLSVGVGSQDRRVLFYATQHEHPLVGGYIGRMPSDAADRYRRTAIAGTLLALSDGAPLPATPDLNVAAAPCRYLVVHRSAMPTALVVYLQLLAPVRIAGDTSRDLYRIR